MTRDEIMAMSADELRVAIAKKKIKAFAIFYISEWKDETN